MFLLDKVRVADLVGAKISTPSAEDRSSVMKMNQTETSYALRLPGNVDQSEHDDDDDDELQQSEDLEGRGVLYCELDTKNIEGADREEIVVDPSMPCVTRGDGP